MAKLYSGTGDGGYTSLLTGVRVEKCSLRICAYGDIDELQAHFGLARSLAEHTLIANYAYQMQSMLIHAMAELASPGCKPKIRHEDVLELEGVIDAFAELLPKGFSFRVPGESKSSAALHVCRASARRAERSLHALAQEEEVNAFLLAWFNRLSDFIYVLARLEDEYEGEIDELKLMAFARAYV